MPCSLLWRTHPEANPRPPGFLCLTHTFINRYDNIRSNCLPKVGSGPLLLCSFFLHNNAICCDIKLSLNVWYQKNNDTSTFQITWFPRSLLWLVSGRRLFFVWEFSSDCECVHFPDEACVTSVECEQSEKVSFLPKGKSTVLCASALF